MNEKNERYKAFQNYKQQRINEILAIENEVRMRQQAPDNQGFTVSAAFYAMVKKECDDAVTTIERQLSDAGACERAVTTCRNNIHQLRSDAERMYRELERDQQNGTFNGVPNQIKGLLLPIDKNLNLDVLQGRLQQNKLIKTLLSEGYFKFFNGPDAADPDYLPPLITEIKSGLNSIKSDRSDAESNRTIAALKRRIEERYGEPDEIDAVMDKNEPNQVGKTVDFKLKLQEEKRKAGPTETMSIAFDSKMTQAVRDQLARLIKTNLGTDGIKMQRHNNQLILSIPTSMSGRAKSFLVQVRNNNDLKGALIEPNEGLDQVTRPKI